MIKVFNSPGRYIQGPYALKEIKKYLYYGKKCLVVASGSAIDQWRAYLEECFEETELVIDDFRGKQCSKKEIDRLVAYSKSEAIDFVVGFGGGKPIDVAKAVSYKLNYKPLIIIPTIASCDAPTSADTVIYNEDGTFYEDWYYNQNPNVVLVDTTIIVNAPSRYLVAGMGDALSTRFEAEACLLSGAKAISGGYATEAAFAIADTCYKILLNYGVLAKQSVENKVVSPAFEKVVEANILLSGLGFENNGIASAHGIHDGLTVINEAHDYLHGEIIAFCTIAQLVLEGRPVRDIKPVLDFCYSVGLPLTLRDIGIIEEVPEKIKKASEAVNFEVAANHPFPVDSESIYNAIILSDSLGVNYLDYGSD